MDSLEGTARMNERKVQGRENCGHFLGAELLPGRLSIVCVYSVVDRYKKPCSLDVLPACTWKLLWAWLMLNQVSKCKIYFQYIPNTTCHLHLENHSSQIISSQIIRLVLIAGLKLSPRCNVLVPECQWLMQLEDFPTEGWCTKKAEHKTYNMHLPSCPSPWHRRGKHGNVSYEPVSKMHIQLMPLL